MNSEDKTIQQYLTEIKKELKCPRSLKSVFLAQLREDIAAFQAKGQLVTPETLQAQFGTPMEIAGSLLDRDDYETLLGRSKRKALVWKILGVAATILFLVAVCYVAKSVYENTTGYVTVSDPF